MAADASAARSTRQLWACAAASGKAVLMPCASMTCDPAWLERDCGLVHGELTRAAGTRYLGVKRRNRPWGLRRPVE